MYEIETASSFLGADFKKKKKTREKVECVEWKENIQLEKNKDTRRTSVHQLCPSNSKENRRPDYILSTNKNAKQEAS
jgi:hypothetical protein